MIEFHAITPHGRELVAQVVDGKLVIPDEPLPANVAPSLRVALSINSETSAL